MKRLLYIFIITILAGGCKKTAEIDGCWPAACPLKAYLSAGDEDKVNAEITRIITTLPSQTYNLENLTALAQRISACGTSAELACFDCIDTLPSQSEIVIRFEHNGTIMVKVIDMSYTPSNVMRFVHMH